MADTNQRIGLEFDVQKTGEVDAAAELKGQIEGIKTTLTATEQSFGAVTTAMENDFRRVGIPLTQTQILLRDLRSRIEEVRSTGGVVPPEFIDRLGELEKAQQQAIEVTGRWRAAQQQTSVELKNAAEDAGTQAQSVNSLDDIVRKLAEDLGPGALKFATWSAAAVGAFTVGYDAGQKLRSGLNWLTDGEFDKSVQAGFARAAESVAGLGTTFEQTAERAQLLHNQLNILRHNGIDAAGLSAQEVQQKVDDLGKKMLKASEDAQEGAKKIKDWAKALPSKDELESEAVALARVIAQFQATHNITPPKLRELFGQEIQGVVNAFYNAGLALPAALRAWADALGVLPTDLDKVKQQVIQRINEMKKELGFKPEDVRTIEQRVREINAALEGIGELSPEQRAKARQWVVDLVNDIAKARGQVTPEVQKLADEFGVATASIGRVSEAAVTATGHLGGVGTTLVSLGVTMSNTGKSSQELAQGVGKNTRAFEEAGTSMNRTGEASKHLGDATKEAAKAAGELGSKSGEANTAVRAVGDTAKEAGDKTAAAAESFKKPALAAATSKVALQELSDRMARIAIESGNAGDALPKVNAALNNMPASAAKAKAALQDIADVDIATKIEAEVNKVIYNILQIPVKGREAIDELRQLFGSGGVPGV